MMSGQAVQAAMLESLEPRLLLDVNMIVNPGFETGDLTGWRPDAGIAVTGVEFHTGAYSAQLTDASMEQKIDTVIGQEYKFKAWIKFESVTGYDWGGFRLEAQSYDWDSLAHSGYIYPSTYGWEWFEVAIDFTATTTQTRLKVGRFAGSDVTIDAYVDDAVAFEKTGENSAPEITSVTVTPDAATGVPTTQSFQVVAADLDGAIERYYWDFGDGTKAFEAAGSRRLATTGTFTGTVYAVDDEGAVASQQFTWSAGDSEFPALSVNPMADEVSAPTVTVTGTASGSAVSVQVSTDRGELVNGVGTSPWYAIVPLAPGNNLLTVQATSSAGLMTTVTRQVRYNPAGALGISNVVADATSVERWQTIEITFDLNNSAATNPQFPYDEAPPDGLEWVDGATVDGVFWLGSDPGTTYRRPAFQYQHYDRQVRSGRDWLDSIGEPVWTVRFAAPVEGVWHYRIEATEAKGSVVSSEGTFTATAVTDPDNHGPIVVSSTDSRYFEYADGTPFLGAGHGISFSRDGLLYYAEQRFAEIGEGNQDFFRWWIAGKIWGSAWQPWRSRTMDYDGNVPAAGLTVDSGFGDGLASIRLDASNPIMMQGWNTGFSSITPGATYVMRIRWRTENITAADPGDPYGVCVKFTGWPTVGATGGHAAVMPHENGDSLWHVSEVTFTDNDYFLGESYICLILENAATGAAYIDEITIREQLPGGELGPNIVMGAEANSHMGFDPRNSYLMDHIFDQAADQNLAFKLVIEEKSEWLLNHFAPYGLPDNGSGNFNRGEGSPTYDLHEYYWRYLSGRFGASTAIHSWEFVNESAPSFNTHFELTNHLAQFSAADGNPHLASTSTWSPLAVEAWKNPGSQDIPYVDFHGYIGRSGFIEPEMEMAGDSAWIVDAYGQLVLDADFGKPTVWGEMGIADPGGSEHGEDPALVLDTEGVWLHKILWAGTGPGAVYPVYWYTDNIYDHSLHHLYGNWNRFMAGVPVSNGNYEDAVATSSNTQMRVMGQKDTTHGEAHLWIDNANNTWRNVVDHAAMPSVSGTVSVSMGTPGMAYLVTWYNTSTGNPASTTAAVADGTGKVTLTIVSLATDTAVKLVRVSDPPTVDALAINDGRSQRSYIESVSVTFDSDVSPSLGVSDLTLYNETTQSPVSIAGAILSYSGGASPAVWDLTGASLLDGQYTVRLLASGIQNGPGQSLDGDGNGTGGDDFVFDLFCLAGDTSGDGSVNLSDLGMLATNYGQTGVNLPGDMDGNGSVDLSDLGILATNYGESVQAAAASETPADQPVLAAATELDFAASVAPVVSAVQVDGSLPAAYASRDEGLAHEAEEIAVVPTAPASDASLDIELTDSLAAVELTTAL